MSNTLAKPEAKVVPQTNKSLAASKPVVRKAPVAKPVLSAKTISAKVAVIEKKPKKEKKAKVVRDSFTMPESDYAKIGELKKVCLTSGMQVKKSELLRAGLHALAKLSAVQLKQAVSALEKIKTGRPKK